MVPLMPPWQSVECCGTLTVIISVFHRQLGWVEKQSRVVIAEVQANLRRPVQDDGQETLDRKDVSRL